MKPGAPGILGAAIVAVCSWCPSELAGQTFPAVVEVTDLDGSNGFELVGAAAGDRAGTAVAGPGDVNDDGRPDVAVGAPFDDAANVDGGVTYVLFGGANPNDKFSALFLSGLDGTRGFGLGGASIGELSGSAVAAAGDVNADGEADLVIGAPSADGGGLDSGNTYVVYGDSDISGGFDLRLLSGLDGTWGLGLQGEAAGDASGTSVSRAGDVNADGRDDLLIGAPGADPASLSGGGKAYVVFGSPTFGGGFATLFLSGLNGSNGFDIDGAAAGDAAASSVAPLGDLNADGTDDLGLGAPDADSSGGDAGAGRSYVVLGGADLNFGFDAISLQFLDSDSRFAFDGEDAGDRSGRAVAGSLDLNDDGVADLVIGAPDRSANGAGSGSTYVVFGGSDVNPGFPTVFLSGLDATEGVELLGTAAGDESGFSVAPAGDLNGDGVDDLVIGAPGAAINGAESGSAFVLFGDGNVNLGFAALFLSGLDGPRGFRLNGQAAGDRLGESVAAIGDLDRDGLDDLVVGAPGRDSNGVDSGSAYVIFGREEPLFSNGFEAL